MSSEVSEWKPLVDGIKPGPASWLSVAYYGDLDTMKQGACSAQKALAGSAAVGFTEAFGARLDEKLGGADGPACCLNAVMFTLMVEEPVFDVSEPIDKVGRCSLTLSNPR